MNGEITVLSFVLMIESPNGDILCCTTGDDEIVYKNVFAVNCIDVNDIQNSLTSKTSQSGTIIIYVNRIYDIDLFNASAEIVLVDHSRVKHVFTRVFSGSVVSCIKSSSSMKLEIAVITRCLLNPIGSFFSEQCRAEFGDSMCKLPLKQYQEHGIVNNETLSRTIYGTHNMSQPSCFTNGTIEFTSGLNTGFRTRVIIHNNDELHLLSSINHIAMIGDSYVVTEGCDKDFFTCRNRFHNVINFRGEPFINGTILASVTKKPVSLSSKNSPSGK